MSRTDKDRPFYVRAYDPLDTMYLNGVEHSAMMHARGECDAGGDPADAKQYHALKCRARCAHSQWTPKQSRARQTVKRLRHHRSRSTYRRAASMLVAAANGGWVEDAEDILSFPYSERGHLGCVCCF